MAASCSQRISSAFQPGPMEKGMIGRQQGGQGGNGGALRHPGLGPSVDESEKRAVGGIQINVFAAGFRQHGGKLGVGQRSEQSQNSSDYPDREDASGGAHSEHHFRRDAENAAANHGPHDDGNADRSPSARRSSGLAACLLAKTERREHSRAAGSHGSNQHIPGEGDRSGETDV